MNEMEQVNGGMIVFIMAIDAACLTTMWAVYTSKYG